VISRDEITGDLACLGVGSRYDDQIGQGMRKFPDSNRDWCFGGTRSSGVVYCDQGKGEGVLMIARGAHLREALRPPNVPSQPFSPCASEKGQTVGRPGSGFGIVVLEKPSHHKLQARLLPKM